MVAWMGGKRPRETVDGLNGYARLTRDAAREPPDWMRDPTLLPKRPPGRKTDKDDRREPKRNR